MRIIKAIIAVLCGFSSVFLTSEIIDRSLRWLLNPELAVTLSRMAMPVAAFVGGVVAGRLSPGKGLLKGALAFSPFPLAFLVGTSGEVLMNHMPLSGVVTYIFRPGYIGFGVMLVAGLASASLGGALGEYIARPRSKGSNKPNE